jgi:hypothetical protein
MLVKIYILFCTHFSFKTNVPHTINSPPEYNGTPGGGGAPQFEDLSASLPIFMCSYLF